MLILKKSIQGTLKEAEDFEKALVFITQSTGTEYVFNMSSALFTDITSTHLLNDHIHSIQSKLSPSLCSKQKLQHIFSNSN